MLLLTTRFLTLIGLNLLSTSFSAQINSQQLLNDISPIIQLKENQIFYTYVFISICVSLVTLFLLKIFKPFIEIYLLYYLRISFYILINLLSVSSVYLVLRVYGYSRFYVLIYILTSSIFLILTRKFSKN
jgi:hypothetical protein